MKKRALLTLTLLCALNFNAQNSIIAINDPTDPQSRFGPAQLVEQVLVTGGCSGVSNFTFQVNGNPGNTNTKSYGYFNRRGATNFPFEEGIILSTGIASGGGNTVIPDPQGGAYPSFENGQGGDADLEEAIQSTGSADATFIKFNFSPTANDVSFRFIMASEEYDGATECAFADGFAFLLREVGTTAYMNLAVLPDGTPVSVRNINSAPGCTSNPGFFEGYDLGDTNYGGRTKVLTASSQVIPGRSYEIKLVVADQGDSAWDSAIFIEAGSFNLGVDLGEDLVISNGNAVCDSESVVLNTESPNADHTWYLNGTEIMGAGNGPFLTVDQPGTYSVDVDFGGACFTNADIVIEFYDPVDIVNVQDLRTCSAGSTFATFDLTENNDDILGTENPADYNITYHTSQVDTNDNSNAITDPSAYMGGDGEIIYVRLENILSGCSDDASFTLFVNNIDFNLQGRYTICVNTDGTEVVTPPVLDTNLNTTDYTFEWYLDGVLLAGEVNSSYVPLRGGAYSVVVTDVASGCMTNIDDPNANALVNESSRPILTADQVSLTFVERNAILASAVEAGTLVNSSAAYEFSLDGGPWLSNNPNDGTYTFENIGSGEHTITARDINGCGEASVTLTVIDYPTNFTPNGDGYNDKWNIVGIKNQPDAKIYIFNRYGKLMKQISPLGEGWDGTFNNVLMPNDDYWFKVEYIEPNDNTKKEFMTHFTLKR